MEVGNPGLHGLHLGEQRRAVCLPLALRVLVRHGELAAHLVQRVLRVTASSLSRLKAGGKRMTLLVPLTLHALERLCTLATYLLERRLRFGGSTCRLRRPSWA